MIIHQLVDEYGPNSPNDLRLAHFCQQMISMTYRLKQFSYTDLNDLILPAEKHQPQPVIATFVPLPQRSRITGDEVVESSSRRWTRPGIMPDQVPADAEPALSKHGFTTMRSACGSPSKCRSWFTIHGVVRITPSSKGRFSLTSESSTFSTSAIEHQLLA